MWLCFAALTAWSQDVHFTQQFDNDLYLNPALTGHGNKANRLIAQYRDQWRTVPVPFSSSFISYDRKIGIGDGGNILGLGGHLVYDRSGDGHLSTIKVSVSPAYTQSFKDDRFRLSVGFQAGVIHRFVDQDGLVFESQYDGTTVNDNSGEPLSGSVTRPDLGMGLHFGSALGDKRHKLEAGFSLYNMHEPNVSLVTNGTDPRPIRYNTYVTSEIFIGSNGWSVNPVFHFQRQEKLDNILPLVYAKKYVKREKRNSAFSFGAGYRIDDAAQMYFAYEIGDFKMGLTYDINTSAFNDATNTVGAGEILLKYEWERKKKEVVIEDVIDSTLVEDTTLVEEELPEEEIVEEVEEVIEETPEVSETETTEPEETIPPKPTILDEINNGIAIQLFFPNDYPDPRSWEQKTWTTYGDNYQAYIRLANEYYRKGGEEGNMIDFILTKVHAEYSRYQTLIKAITEALRDGKQVTVSIRGYTSPLANNAYNENLSKRRIMSVVNQMTQNNTLKYYLDQGQLTVEELPLGETRSDESVSDDLNDKKRSVYSEQAAFERRVEIEKVVVE